MRGILLFALVFLVMFNANFSVAVDLEWQDSFDRICAITAESENLTIDQLNDLINESDVLLLKIEADNVPKKKLYLIRLKRCRNFLVFMRDVKQDNK